MATASKEQKTDRWRITEILVPLGTPIAVAIIALVFNAMESSRDQRNKAEQERIARFTLIPAFMDALTGTDQPKKTLAIRSITAILGAEGTALLAGLDAQQVAGLSPEAQQVVASAAQSRARQIIGDLYAKDLTLRTDAYRDLLLSGLNDEQVVPLIIDFGLSNRDNLVGVKDTLRYLDLADQSAVTKWSTEVNQFLRAVESNGPETKALASQVEQRLSQGTSTPETVP